MRYNVLIVVASSLIGIVCLTGCKTSSDSDQNKFRFVRDFHSLADANIKKGSDHYMEDRVVVKQGLPGYGDESFDYFAVFDGHGGEYTAQWLKVHFHTCVQAKIKKFASGKDGMMRALNAAFEDADRKLKKKMVQSDGELEDDSGSTGTVAIIRYENINGESKRVSYIANAGDSEAVLVAPRSWSQPIESVSVLHKNYPDLKVPYVFSVVDEQFKYTMLTAVHHPMQKYHGCAQEELRLERSHQVVRHGKHKGYFGHGYDDLCANSRGFGDFIYKVSSSTPQDYIVNPSISRIELPASSDETDLRLVLASDGFWDELHPVKPEHWPTDAIHEHTSMESFANDLMAKCKEKWRSGKHRKYDNVSIITIDLCLVDSSIST